MRTLTQSRLSKWCHALVPVALISFTAIPSVDAAPRVAALEKAGSASLIEVGSRGYDWGQGGRGREVMSNYNVYDRSGRSYRGHHHKRAVKRHHAKKHHVRKHHYHNKRHYNNRDVFVSGAIGLAAGALIGNAIASPNHYYTRPRVVTYAPKPWTGAWYRYCADKYRSFDPRSGTFQPYHGPRQLCR
jgi:hypothetical protein